MMGELISAAPRHLSARTDDEKIPRPQVKEAPLVSSRCVTCRWRPENRASVAVADLVTRFRLKPTPLIAEMPAAQRLDAAAT